LLAKLPLKIYITTSYYNFIERALEAENKKPRTQVVFWSGVDQRAKPEHTPDPLYEPSDTEPAVYHLFGLEDYPQTLVLSEDDYLNFLFTVVDDTNPKKPIVPLRLREALAESRLLLFGYRAQDWEFQVLLSLLLTYRSKEHSSRSFLTQLENEEKLKTYLSRYFDKRHFDIEWSSAEMFIQRLWNAWDEYRRA